MEMGFTVSYTTFAGLTVLQALFMYYLIRFSHPSCEAGTILVHLTKEETSIER